MWNLKQNFYKLLQWEFFLDETKMGMTKMGMTKMGMTKMGMTKMGFTNQLVAMFRILGLLTCVSLALIFPMWAYKLNGELIAEFTGITIIGCIIVIKFIK